MTLDRETAELLVSGRMAPFDAPPHYARVAAVLAAASAPTPTSETASSEAAGVRLAAVARESTPGLWPPRRIRSFRISFPSKIAVVGMAAVLVLTGSLAAAGALPDGMQGVAHTVFKKVGIHVPGPNARAGNHPFERGKSGKPKKHRPGQPRPAKNTTTQTPSEGGS